VIGQGAASGISGFPSEQVVNSDSTGTSTFSFIPSDNAYFVNNRITRWASGSTSPNPPIAFDVVAKVVNGDNPSISQLSETQLNQLVQDTTDILRQEYLDYNIDVPDRDEVVPTVGPGYNMGNYNVQVSEDMDTQYAAVLAAYRGSIVMVGSNSVRIPNSAQVSISCGFRCPQRNKAIGSVHPNSKHCYGRALDLVPAPVWVNINGVPTRVSLHGQLYPALFAACQTVGTALAEDSAVPLSSPTDTTANHIHVQW